MNARLMILKELIPTSWVGRFTRLLLVWPLKLVVMLGTLILAGLMIDEPVSIVAALLLPLIYGLMMLLPIALAEVSAWMLRRRWGRTPPKTALVLWGATVFPVIAFASYWGFMSVPVYVFGSLPGILSPSVGLAAVAMLPAGAITAWVLWRHWISKGIEAQLRVAEGEREKAEQQRALAEANLAVLQAQIEPHFLYNTLANVQYLVRKDPKAGDHMLSQFIRYLRAAMPSMRTGTSTIGREMDLADSYLQMAAMRLGGRLSVRVDCPDEIRDLPFPPLVVQTLVENALIHGVEPKVGKVSIEVVVGITHRRLVIDVRDDGVGLGGAQTSGSGTGLKNIRERILAIYGPGSRLSVASQPGGGVLSRIQVELEGDVADVPPVPHDLAAHNHARASQKTQQRQEESAQ